MPFQIIRDNLIHVKADAIVNSANPKPVIGGGTEQSIYAAAGEKELLAERKKIGAIAPGACAATEAFALPAKYILHTVGPVWRGGDAGERETLRACYANTLALAAELKCRSAAFPLISAGMYHFPADQALMIALSEIQNFLLTHEMKVTLVVFAPEALELSEKLVGEIDQYIDEHGVHQVLADEGVYSARERRRERMMLSARVPAAGAAASAAEKPSLDDVLKSPEKTFQERLFELIDESGMEDVAVYKKANISRKLFSRIRGHSDYQPKKKTALALAIALELDKPTTEDLLARAGLAMSQSNAFDLIISYYIENRIYDIYEINTALFRYGQPMLGY